VLLGVGQSAWEIDEVTSSCFRFGLAIRLKRGGVLFCPDQSAPGCAHQRANRIEFRCRVESVLTER
jgi:hypothetical protein